MAWYRCMIRGENFPIKFEGEPGPYGFYTTRFVEAVDEADAEMKAVDMLRHDPDLVVPPGTPGMDCAQVYVEQIEPVTGPCNPGAGFTFFREKA